jgi:hypothetical protein
MNNKDLQVAITFNLQAHTLTLFFRFSTDIEQQTYLSWYEDLCNMTVICETGVCQHGEAEDSNPL